MEQDQVIQLIRQEIQRAMNLSTYGVRLVPYHTHNGTDSPALNPQAVSSTAFTDLSDTPHSYTGQATKRVTVNSTENGLQFITDTFLNLTDTPNSYSGQGTKLVRVNAGATALEFVTATSTSPGGSNGDLQINASGSFGTIGGLNLDQTGNSRGTTALDIQSYRSAVANVASGNSATALGVDNLASGASATAVGIGNSVTGSTNASAFGNSNTASGAASTALGSVNSASGASTTAVGTGNTANFSHATALGVSNAAGGVNDSIAIGNSNTNTGGTSGSPGKSFSDGYGNTTKQYSGGGSLMAVGVNNTVDLGGSGDGGAVGVNISNSETGTLQLGISATAKFFIQGASTHIGNFGFNGSDSQNYANGVGVIYILDATTLPGATPSGGGVLYSNAGALKWKGSSGTITTIAVA